MAPLFRWLRLVGVAMAWPYACGLGVEGLGDLMEDAGPGANVEDDASSDATSDSSSGSPDGGDSASPAASCPLVLQDLVTACTSASPDCPNGCGPELPDGGTLGSTTCSCNVSTGVYNCASCVIQAPLPPCYVLPNKPPTCPARTASGAPCTKVCNPAKPNATPGCASVTMAGTVEACQCILKAGTTQPAWTCALRW